MAAFNTFTEEDSKKTPEEIFAEIKSGEVVDAKEMPYEDKIRFMKYCMNYDGLQNAALLTNISFLVYGKNISDEVFADARIVFKNLEEYVDAKYDLKAEIEAYGRNLLKFYLAALKSYSVILPDGKIPVPASYRAILYTSDTSDISKIMNKYSFDTKDIPLVFDAEELINSFSIMDYPEVKDFVNYVMETLRK